MHRVGHRDRVRPTERLGHRGVDVRDVGLQRRPDIEDTFVLRPCAELGQERHGPRRVARSNGVGLAGFPKLVRRELADGFEHPVAHGAAGLIIDLEERLTFDGVEQVHHIDRSHDVTVGGDRLSRGERPAAEKDAEAPQQGPLRLAQQIAAPQDRGFERLLTRKRGARSSTQKAERVVEAAADLACRQGAASRRGELDGERHAVEPTADLGDIDNARVGQRETGTDPTGTIDEERNGLKPGQLLDAVGSVDDRRAFEQRNPPRHLARDVQSRPARDEDANERAGHHDCFDHTSDLVDDVLGVVQDQERRAAGQPAREAGQRIGAGVIADADGIADRDHHCVGSLDPCQIHPPHAVGEPVDELCRRLDSQTGLPGAAGSRQRHDTVGLEQASDGGDLIGAADEARQERRQSALLRSIDDEGRERSINVRHFDLPNVLRSRQTLERVDPEIGERHLCAELIHGQIPSCLRHQDLAAMADGARRAPADDRDAGVVDLVTEPGLPGVDRHANRQRPPRRPRLSAQRHLRVDCSPNRVRDPREGRDDTVALALLLRTYTSMCADRSVHQLVVALHGERHGVGLHLPAWRRSLDIRQEESNRSNRDRMIPARRRGGRAHRWCLTDHDVSLHGTPFQHVPCSGVTHSAATLRPCGTPYVRQSHQPALEDVRRTSDGGVIGCSAPLI